MTIPREEHHVLLGDFMDDLRQNFDIGDSVFSSADGVTIVNLRGVSHSYSLPSIEDEWVDAIYNPFTKEVKVKGQGGK